MFESHPPHQYPYRTEVVSSGKTSKIDHEKLCMVEPLSCRGVALIGHTTNDFCGIILGPRSNDVNSNSPSVVGVASKGSRLFSIFSPTMLHDATATSRSAQPLRSCGRSSSFYSASRDPDFVSSFVNSSKDQEIRLRSCRYEYAAITQPQAEIVAPMSTYTVF